MKVFNVIRTTLLVAAVLGACGADATKAKLCDADGHPAPAPVPAKAGGAPAPAPAPVRAPAPAPAPVPAPVPAAAPKPAKAESLTIGSPAVTPAVPGSANSGSDSDSDSDSGADSPAAGKNDSPAGAPSAPAPAGGVATNAGTVKGSFTYKGSDAGGPGTYNMVMDVGTCSKAAHSMYSPVSPLDDDISLVFRGSMTIFNIAIFDGSSGAWNKVSSFTKGGETTNMVFLNNHNIDYSGTSSPQGFATADGKGTAQSPVTFAGVLGAATSPNGYSVYADEKTGAEVNILQNKKCGTDGVDCKGYYDKDGTAYLGWGGAKKIFVTKVQMPHAGAPDMPAIWALNGQIVRSQQYGCNCRGMGTQGGCGEFDIAEVIEKDLDVVATHYYKYESSTGHDSWGKRPTDAPTTYITIIDESFGVKVVEVGCEDFDFTAGSISNDVVAKWLSA